MADNLPNGIITNRYLYNLHSKKTLVITDLHCPYHNKPALKQTLYYAQKQKITAIVLLGDIIDFYMISRFNKIPSAPNLQYELDTTISVLKYIRELFPKIQIFYIRGNHERRLLTHLCKNAELFSLNNMMLDKLLKLNELNITLLEDFTLIKYGNFILMHGDEIKGGGVDNCRSKLNISKCSIIFGHHHNSDIYQTNTLDNRILTSIAVGTLGEISPDYSPYNMNWSLGFCIINEYGEFKNYKIINDKII
jgi:predicted phosphodiesterase